MEQQLVDIGTAARGNTMQQQLVPKNVVIAVVVAVLVVCVVVFVVIVLGLLSFFKIRAVLLGFLFLVVLVLVFVPET